jgi:hypothetical protein
MTVNELGQQLYQGAANMLHAIANSELSDIGRSVDDIFVYVLIAGFAGLFVWWPFAAIRGWQRKRLEQEAKEAQKKLAQLGAADLEKLRANVRDVFRRRSLAETTAQLGGKGKLGLPPKSSPPRQLGMRTRRRTSRRSTRDR